MICFACQAEIKDGADCLEGSEGKAHEGFFVPVMPPNRIIICKACFLQILMWATMRRTITTMEKASLHFLAPKERQKTGRTRKHRL